MTHFFTVIFYQPILNLLVWLYNIIPGHDIGVAIILLTVIIRTLLLPLSKKAIESQKSLQELQPKMEELKKQYEGDKEALGKATLELYRKNKINPFFPACRF
jgi:YidC/Oxa1 family membrane protein insertase